MKRIHSEIKLDDDLFKVKICTTDKKHPDTIYVEMGSYISPNDEEESYTDTISNISKSIRSYAKNKIKTNPILTHDIILVTDVADERIKKGKKSYFDIQLHMKPTTDCLIANGDNFKNLSEEVYKTYVSKLLPYIKSSIIENGFSCSKVKK